MGEVWKAHDGRLDRTVAIKTLRGALDDATDRERFRREARVLSRLSHPGVATVFDFDAEQGYDVLVMEYVSGGTLERRLASVLEGPGYFRSSLQVEIGVRYVDGNGGADGKTVADFAHLPLRVAMYCDGNLHGELRIRELDNRVVEALQAVGWFVLRFTGREIQRRPAECLARIRRALERAPG